MNERIRELAEQAGFMVDQSNRIMVCFTSDGDSEVKRFAELIVKECIEQIRAVGDLRGANDDMIYGVDIAAIRLSKHFGVQE